MNPLALVAINYPRLSDVIARNLTHIGFDVHQCRTNTDLLEHIQTGAYSAYVIETEFDTNEPGERHAQQLYERIAAGRILFITNRPYTAEMCRQRGIGCVNFVDLTLDHQRQLRNGH